MNIFSRTELLLGEEAVEKLKNSRVAVFGVGGVGGYAVEALARSGVGALTVMDEDSVSETNINRQCVALSSTLGMPKAEVMAARIRDIAPDCAVKSVVGRYDAETREKFFSAHYDFIADAIDLVACKLDLICTASERGIPIISALGTGNKRDAALLRLDDIAKTYGCTFARVIRRELRARGVEHHPVVYSPEEPMTPAQMEAPPPGRRSVPGSLVWVPAAAGMLLCQYVVTELIKE